MDSPLKTRRENTFRKRRTFPHGMPGRTQRIPSVTMPQDTDANHTPLRSSRCHPCGSTKQRVSNALFKSVGEHRVRKVVTDSNLAVPSLNPVVLHEGNDGRRSSTRPPRATTACALVIARTSRCPSGATTAAAAANPPPAAATACWNAGEPEATTGLTITTIAPHVQNRSTAWRPKKTTAADACTTTGGSHCTRPTPSDSSAGWCIDTIGAGSAASHTAIAPDDGRRRFATRASAAAAAARRDHSIRNVW